MFIDNLIQTANTYYSRTGQKAREYDEAIYHVLKDDRLTPSAKSTEVKRLRGDRAAYIRTWQKQFRADIDSILNGEREEIKKRVTNRPVSTEMANTLTLIRTMGNLTQNELDQYAEACKGVYMAERVLHEVAKANGLKYDFLPLEAQLEKLERVVADFAHVQEYAGERTADLIYNGQPVGVGTGRPLWFQAIEKDLDNYKARYERGNFTPAQEKPRPIDILRGMAVELKEEGKYSKSFEVEAFIDRNRSLLMSPDEAVAATVAEFLERAGLKEEWAEND